MKSYSIQRVGDHRQEGREVRIEEGKRMTLGAATDAHIPLFRSAGVPEYCLDIWIERGKCLAENVSRNSGLITLNGHYLYSVELLENGDFLQIGNDLFTVVYQDDTPLQPTVPVPVPIEPELSRHSRSLVLRSMFVNASLSRHEPDNCEWSDSDVLRRLAEDFNGFPLVNFRHAGTHSVDTTDFGDDLFEHAPDEVRDLYSLHALLDATEDQKLNVYYHLKGRDAAVWVVPEQEPATCLKDAKIYLAWFARASILDMTLQRSPKVFTEGLMKPFKAIVLRPTIGGSWSMYTKSGTDPSLFQLEKSVATQKT